MKYDHTGVVKDSCIVPELAASVRGIIYHTQSIVKVVLQKSTPPQVRQLIFTITDVKNKLTDLCGN